MRGPHGKGRRRECDYRNGFPLDVPSKIRGKDRTVPFPFDSLWRLLIGLTRFFSCAYVQAEG